jgi:HD-GYP domain-containing protein (c-di-GMP phosphodiesterase class II)
MSNERDLLSVRFRETLAMLDTAIRMVQAYPDAPSAQLRLCEGLEVTLQVVAERIEHIQCLLAQQRRHTSRLDSLTELLAALESGKTLDVQPFIALAEALLEEAHQGAPLRFFQAEPEHPARFIASHSLVVAQVMARLIKHEMDLRHQPMEPVLAALVHDVGMLRIPVAILAHRGTLPDDERRTVESHTRIGADLATRLFPSGSWLAEATANHHERLDGTGYPGGLRELQISPLVRLLAVCDTYAALCAPRPHRAAFDPRTALTDALLLAEKGALDKGYAERLLHLSFYPVGSVVELADGSIGVVVATHMNRRDLNTPGRPVLVLLTDEQGKPLPVPQHVDLAQWDNRSIVRALQPAQRRQVLGQRYPEYL